MFSLLQAAFALFSSHLIGATLAFLLVLIVYLCKNWREGSAPMTAIEKKRFEIGGAVASASTCARVSNRQEWLSGYIQPLLLTINEDQYRSAALKFRLGIAVIACNALSSLVTGAGGTIPGLPVITISFFITSAGAFASAVLLFGGWNDSSDALKVRSGLILQEMWQFVASSDEYAGLDLDQQWLLLTCEVHRLIAEGLRPIGSDKAANAEKAMEQTGPAEPLT
jgi:hypothetical protein